MGSRSSPDDKSRKKKAKKEMKKSKSKSRSRSLKETGSFERVLNNYCSTGMVNAKTDEQWLNLAIELKPLDEMVGDRDRLMNEVFAILGGDQPLRDLLPEVIKKANHSIEEIKELLVSECKRMSDDDVVRVLKGKKAVVPANQKPEPPKSVEKVTTDELTKSFLQVAPGANNEPTPSQMELLELEMRARAIKSLMHQQTVPGSNNTSTPEDVSSPAPPETQGTGKDISSSSVEKPEGKAITSDTTEINEDNIPSCSTGSSTSVKVEMASKKQSETDPDKNEIEEYIPPGEKESRKIKTLHDAESLVPISDNDVLITEISDEETAPL